MSDTFIPSGKFVNLKNPNDVVEADKGVVLDAISEENGLEALSDVEYVGEIYQRQNEVITKSLSDDSKSNEWIDMLGSGAIMKLITRKGKPDLRPQKSEKCKISYICSLENGTIVDCATDFELYLGEFEVVSGLDLSLGLMNVEEKCILKLEPRLAFGKKGLYPKIPGDSIVIYDVELLSVEPEDDIEFLTLHERKVIGNKKREKGNWWYMRSENNIAIQCYRRALDYLDEVEGGIGSLSNASDQNQITDADLQALLEDRISVCNNMAAAQIKMEMYDAALHSLQIVLRCQPKNLKAHFRKAKVYIGKNDLAMAMECLHTAKEIAPEDSEIQKEVNAVTKIMEKQNLREREVAKRMFNVQTKSKANKKEPKEQTNKMGLWTTVGAVVVVGVAGFVAYRFKFV